MVGIFAQPTHTIMGWGVTLNNVYISRATVKGLQSEMDEATEYANRIKNNLIALVANTSNVYPGDDGPISIVEYAANEVPDMLEVYADLTHRMFLLQHAIDNPDDIVREDTETTIPPAAII